MTILITADWHVSDNPRDEYRWAWLKKLPAILRKEKVELLLVLGDLTEAKDEHKAELVNTLVDTFHQLAQVCPVVITKGNHDWVSNPDNPFFAFLRRIERVSWVGGPLPLNKLQNVSTTVSRALGRGAILLPHSPAPERDWAKIDFHTYDWAFCHQTFANAISDSSGFRLSGIPLSIFPKQLRIVSGDIHRPQTLGNLTYVGAPYQLDFGDSFEPRLLLIDDNGKMHSLPCDGPQKQLVEVKSIAELKKQEHLVPGDILKIRVEITADRYADWPEIAAQVRAWGIENQYQIHMVQPVVVGAARSMTKERKSTPAKDDAELLKEYAKHRGLDDKTVSTGLQLLG